jgi:prepilin-type processing-associated H-X9-DG protein
MQDHDQTFPLKTVVWADVNFPPKSTICPTYGVKKGIGYGYNSNLSGKALNDPGMAESQMIPVLADSKTANHLLVTTGDVDPRHTGKAMVAFADGHVALLLLSQISIVPSCSVMTEILDQEIDWSGPTGGSNWRRFCTASDGNYKKALPTGWSLNSLTYQDGAGSDGYIGGVGWRRDRLIHMDGSFAGYPGTGQSGYAGNLELDIPLNPAAMGSPCTVADFYVLTLPKFYFSAMGMEQSSTLPLDGWAEIQLLDNNKAVIAGFRLDLSGATATYSANGQAIATMPNDDQADPYWGSGVRTYKYASSYYGGYDGWDHTLSFIGTSSCILVAFSSPWAPQALGGMVMVPSAGGVWNAPTYLRLTVMNNNAGRWDGRGGILLWSKAENGGVYYGTE